MQYQVVGHGRYLPTRRLGEPRNPFHPTRFKVFSKHHAHSAGTLPKAKAMLRVDHLQPAYAESC